MNFRLAATFSFILALTTPALAQTPGGTVTGSVRDEQGASPLLTGATANGAGGGGREKDPFSQKR